MPIAARNKRHDEKETDDRPQPYRDGENNLGFAYGGGMLPTTVLYDAAGKEVWRVTGEIDWDGARATELLKPVLG